MIGADALLLSGVRIGARVRIGDRFIAQPGAVLGGDGFSFVTPTPGVVEEARETGAISSVEQADYVRINSLGSIGIGDDVEIGANSCIDRGTIADTMVGDGTKIDNLVQIGHNVRIGHTCLICGQAGVAGSTVIGDRVVLGGKAAVADHLRIGSNVVITGNSGVEHPCPRQPHHDGVSCGPDGSERRDVQGAAAAPTGPHAAGSGAKTGSQFRSDRLDPRRSRRPTEDQCPRHVRTA